MLRLFAFLAYLISWAALGAGAMWNWFGGKAELPDPAEQTTGNLVGMALQATSALPIVAGLEPGPLPSGALSLSFVPVFAPLAAALFLWALRQGRAGGLVTTGPFALVRHPIYLAFFLMLLATAMVAGAPAGRTLLSFAAYIAGTELRVAVEEAALRKRFPDEHEAYRRRVRSLYLPGLR